MIRAVVFDFDYTLGDSSKGIELSVNYALTEMGYAAASSEAVSKTIGLSLPETFARLTGFDSPEKAARFTSLFKQKADNVMVDNTSLYPDAIQTLQLLRNQGCKTAIVTTKFHYRIRQILKRFDAVHLIDLIVGAEDVKLEKPSPEGLLWVIEHLGTSADEVVYVGDSIVDAQTAKNAGIQFFGTLTGATERGSLQQYPHIFIGQNLTEIYHHLYSFPEE